MRKLAVCYPGDTPTVYMLAFQSIANIVSPKDCEVRWFRGVGWCQARRRNHAAEQAIEWGADLIACLDIDQVYEPDILERLVSRYDEGYRMIAAMVPGRGYVHGSNDVPFQRLGWKLSSGQFTMIDPADGDIQEAEFPTSAAILFCSGDLQRLKKPWYFYTYKPDDWSQVHGEDATFALRMKREVGVQGYVDTTIKVGHVAAFSIDDTFSERFADWATPGVGDPAICKYPHSDGVDNG